MYRFEPLASNISWDPIPKGVETGKRLSLYKVFWMRAKSPSTQRPSTVTLPISIRQVLASYSVPEPFGYPIRSKINSPLLPKALGALFLCRYFRSLKRNQQHMGLQSSARARPKPFSEASKQLRAPCKAATLPIFAMGPSAYRSGESP